MERFICVHGHFYQPPRENPWLEDVELQDSAHPYHDWNARVTAECYAANAASRILDRDNRIVDIVSNYEKMSFDFGPTLLSWMQLHAHEEYAAVLQADKESAKHFSQHGSAIAQAYNHMIMPLANSRDKRTQVVWGIRDFKYRFGRDPEGMWLPETAVDIETLEILADCGIKFTILAPGQAQQVRKIGGEAWNDVANGTIDPKQSYLCVLPSKKNIALFFYDGSISGGVSSGAILHHGEDFANRLVSAFTQDDKPSELVHLAVDGETFGHHHRYSDMALAYCLYYIESKNLARITNYGEFLEKYPPEYEVRIKENTSWSCAHGIERWRSDCGCNTGGHPGWTQKWRGPLREAMDFVRDAAAPIYERQMQEFVQDPWQVRNEYIDVILDRSEARVQEFLAGHAGRQLNESEKTQMIKLLEMQRHCLLMYTSCGWFFDEISGIEGVQVMLYAARAMQLAQQTSGTELENNYKEILAKAPSNVKRLKNGSGIYEKFVQPAAIDLPRVGAHYAVSSLFGEYPTSSQIYCYSAVNELFQRWEIGTLALVVGRASLRSNITLEKYIIDFAVLHLFEHNIYGGVSGRLDDELFARMSKEMELAFAKSDISGVIRALNTYFGTYNYSLWYLFKDEQRKILNQISTTSMKDIEFAFRYIYERHYPLMRAMREVMMPLPKSLSTPAEIVISSDFVNELEKEDFDIRRLQNFVTEIQRESFELDKATVGYAITTKINSLMKRLYDNAEDIATLGKLEAVLRILSELPHDLELWKAQNMCFALRKTVYDHMYKNAQEGNENAQKWIRDFNSVADYLDVKVS
jgi:alpha-amylase/alpha-mannosidase (GH57 family)